MKPAAYKIQPAKLSAAFCAFADNNPEEAAFFVNCVITSMRFSWPHNRAKLVICADEKETGCKRPMTVKDVT